jgi:hypothetical protein
MNLHENPTTTGMIIIGVAMIDTRMRFALAMCIHNKAIANPRINSPLTAIAVKKAVFRKAV